MSRFAHVVGSKTYLFCDLKDLMAKATPARSGDYLAGVAAGSAEERVAAQMALAAVPLTVFLRVCCEMVQCIHFMIPAI
jgi:ethanolamine ammonia-lyase large subunit